LTGKAKRTKGIYLAGARALLAFLAERWAGLRLENLTREHVLTWKEYLVRESGLAPATIRINWSGARALCKMLRAWDRMQGDPFDRVGDLPRVVMPELDLLTDDEVGRIFRACDKDRDVWGRRDRAVVALLASTGMRQQEVLGLTPADVDVRKQLIQVKHTKGGIPRVNLLADRVAPHVAAYLHARTRWIAHLPGYRRRALEGVLWLSQRSDTGLTAAGLGNLLRQRAAQAGVDPHKAHPHAWRHLCATKLAEAGIPQLEVNYLMGWTPGSAMPARYMRHNVRERALERLRRLEAGLPLSMGGLEP
jgi:integrase/recombinase XerD